MTDVIDVVMAGIGPPGPVSGAAGGDLAGAFPDPSIKAGAVTETKLADAAVTLAKLADGAVSEAKLSFSVATQLEIDAVVASLTDAIATKATPADVEAAVTALVSAAPEVLDTLNELAAALGDDPNFATTVLTALAGKQDLIPNGTYVQAAENLADLANAATARANIGAAPTASPTFTGTVTVPGVVTTGPIAQTQPGTLGAPANADIFSFQPRDPAKAKFRATVGGAAFGGFWDSVMYFGYNVGVDGAPEMANEPSFRFNIEQDYYDGVKHTLEAYFEYIPKSGLFDDTRRPLFWQFDRDKGPTQTGANSSWTFCGESISFLRWSDNANFLQLSPGNFTMFGLAGLPSSFALNTPAGQGSAFYMQHAGANGLTISTQATSILSFNVGTGLAEMYIWQGAGISVNLYDNSQAFGVESPGGSRTVAIRAHASQVGAQTEWQDSTGAYGTKINKNNYFMTKKATAPADADLANGEMALWFDPTNGAAKLMVKAKQTDGTVRTGELALA